MSRGGVTVQEGLCPGWGLSPEGSLFSGVCPWGLGGGGVCQGGSLSGKSLCRALCLGSLYREEVSVQ